MYMAAAVWSSSALVGAASEPSADFDEESIPFVVASGPPLSVEPPPPPPPPPCPRPARSDSAYMIVPRLYTARWNPGSRRMASRNRPTASSSRVVRFSGSRSSDDICWSARPQLLSAWVLCVRATSHSTAARYFSHACPHIARASTLSPASPLSLARSPSAMPQLYSVEMESPLRSRALAYLAHASIRIASRRFGSIPVCSARSACS